MPPTPKDWRERFHEEIGKYIENRNIVLVYPDKLVIQIKDFIASLFQEQRDEIVEKIEELQEYFVEDVDTELIAKDRVLDFIKSNN